jgi:hypothetical protein
MTEEPILYRLIETVRGSRQRTAAYFPMPDAGSCIDYAITEAAEYLDAYLRAHRADDKRRQDKDHSMVKEWGQCGYMLVSALIQHDLRLNPEDCELMFADDGIEVYGVIQQMCGARKDGERGVLFDAIDLWTCFAMQTLHVEPLALMVETCRHFEDKFVPHLEVGGA